MIYLDSAATSLWKPPRVGDAVARAIGTMTTPGRGGHPPAMRAADAVFRCRELAAEMFHLEDPARVVFTMNATHGLNIAIRSLAGSGDRVLISGFEHNAVTRPLHAIGAEIRVAGRRLFDWEDTLRSFRQQIDGVKLVVCTHVSNVFGHILPIAEIAALCREKGVPLIVDASQSAGILELDAEALQAAFVAMPGHKGLMGPQGTGLLLCGTDAAPLLFGGSGSDSRLQEMPEFYPDRLEAGTQNVCGIAGLFEGMRYVTERGTGAILRHERMLLRQAIDALAGSGYELFTGPDWCQSGVLSLRAPGIDMEQLASLLAEHGVCVRSGLHCAPLAHESAGTADTGTLRMSFSPAVSRSQVLRACSLLRQLGSGRAEMDRG